MKLVNIGFGNMVSAARLVAIVSPDSAPIKRIIQDARERNINRRNIRPAKPGSHNNRLGPYHPVSYTARNNSA